MEEPVLTQGDAVEVSRDGLFDTIDDAAPRDPSGLTTFEDYDLGGPGVAHLHLAPEPAELGAPVDRALAQEHLPLKLREKPGCYVATKLNWSFVGRMARQEGIDDLGLRDHIEFISGVPEQRIIELYSEAELAVVPTAQLVPLPESVTTRQAAAALLCELAFGETSEIHRKLVLDEQVVEGVPPPGATLDIAVACRAHGLRPIDGPYGDFGSRKYVLASLDQSLKRMGLEYVDM